MTDTEVPRRVWQRVPQGWIEFRSFGDRTPDEWLAWWLESGEGWLPETARSAIEDGFRAGVRTFAGSEFDFAGVSIVLGERPAVTFLSTLVVGAGEDASSMHAFHRLFPLARFGADSAAETFTSPDGRVGTVLRGTVTHAGSTVVMSVGEIRLAATEGTVIVLGMCSDPEQAMELSVLTAFALATTQWLPEGEEPVLTGELADVPDVLNA